MLFAKSGRDSSIDKLPRRQRKLFAEFVFDPTPGVFTMFDTEQIAAQVFYDGEIFPERNPVQRLVNTQLTQKNRTEKVSFAVPELR